MSSPSEVRRDSTAAGAILRLNLAASELTKASTSRLPVILSAVTKLHTGFKASTNFLFLRPS